MSGLLSWTVSRSSPRCRLNQCPGRGVVGLRHRRVNSNIGQPEMSEFLNDTAVVTGGEARSGKVETFTVDLPTKQGKSWSRISLVPVALVALTALAAGLVSSLLTDASFRGDFGWIAAVAIFVSSYVALAIGRVPGLGLDRAGITLVGAAMMVACGALPLDQAYAAVDLDTLTLLLGMMIVVAHLRLSGFLTLVTVFIARRTHHP